MRLLFLVLLFATLSVRAQTNVRYFDIITGDSVRMFIDAAAMFGSGVTRITGRECAKGYRFTRISSTGALDGKFKDYMLMGTRPPSLMAEGTYKNGRKEGRFTWYSMNNKVRCEGDYVNDLPSGDWNFYSDNGKLIMVLQFNGEEESRINYMFDEKSNMVIVKDGNGEARYVSQFTELPYSVSGRIKDGFAEGEWIGEAEQVFDAVLTKKSIRRETYRAGVMVAGKKFQSGRVTDVCCSPELTRIFPLPIVWDILDLETFPIEPCPQEYDLPALEPEPTPRSAEATSDLRIFSSSVKAAILGKYQGRQIGEGYNPTTPGNEENKLVIQFNTDEKGNPVKLRLISSYGREFYLPIKRALESQTTWHPNQTKLILTVFIRMGIYTYNYRINFSLG